MPKALSNEKQEIIYKYYPVLKPQEVADMVGMKKENVVAWAYKHGISNNRYWTKEEEEYLISRYGRSTVKQISKRLGKSYGNVLNKINHMGLGRFVDNSIDLSQAEVSRLVGRDKETLKNTWVKYGLKISKKGRFSMIKEQDLLDFMKNNPERWDATKCECWYFENYDWFREKHREDFKNMCAKRWKGAINENIVGRFE